MKNIAYSYGYSCCGNNYTRNISFKRANNNPKYMQVLSCMAKLGPSKRSDIVMHIWNVNLAKMTNGWNCGPFTLLRQNNLATYDNATHLWKITSKGKRFLKTVKDAKH